MSCAHADQLRVNGAVSPSASNPPHPAGNADKPEMDFSRIAELNLLSQGLVEKAGAGNAPAHEYRIQARMYRELLRRLMLDNRALPDVGRLPQPMLLDMVRMAALLHSAADCKTGLVITCPPDLMRQLISQQALLDRELKLGELLRE